MWDISSPGRDQTRFCCTGRQILNHCTIREVPAGRFITVEPPGKPLPSSLSSKCYSARIQNLHLTQDSFCQVVLPWRWFCHPPPISCTREGGHSPRFPKTFSAPPQFPSFKASPPLRIQCPSSILLTLSFTVVHQRSSLFHWNFEIESYRLCPLFELQYPCLENSMDIGAWQLQSVGLWRVGHDWACTLILHL